MSLAAAAEKDGFFYAGDSLYREASNHNRHRRASVPELKAHFNGKDTDKKNDRPAHWYEAQLLHYGLPPSKVKGTAHKRLFDAVIKGGLVVPSHIQKIEADLKKEWTKREREAKKMLKESAAGPQAKKGPVKRKADQVSNSNNVSVQVNVVVTSTGQFIEQTAQPAAKKAKTATAPKTARKTITPKAPKAAATKATPSTKLPKAAGAKAIPPTKTPKAATKATLSTKAPKTATKATPSNRLPKAASTKATPSTKNPKAATKSAPSPKPAKSSVKGSTVSKLMGSSKASGSAIMGHSSFDDAPPPYSEVDTGLGSSRQAPQQSSPNQSKLGLLNGRYKVQCLDLEREFEDHAPDFGFIATLDNNRLWLKFDFGAVTGVMMLDRPWGVADGRRGTTWRGHAPDDDGDDDEELVFQGPDDRNWVESLGDGHVRGSISWVDYNDYSFQAQRLPNQPMRSGISPSEMRETWDKFERGSHYKHHDEFDGRSGFDESDSESGSGAYF